MYLKWKNYYKFFLWKVQELQNQLVEIQEQLSNNSQEKIKEVEIISEELKPVKLSSVLFEKIFGFLGIENWKNKKENYLLALYLLTSLGIDKLNCPSQNHSGTQIDENY